MAKKLTPNQKSLLGVIQRRGAIYVKGRDILSARALKRKGFVTLHDSQEVWLSGFRYDVRLKKKR